VNRRELVALIGGAAAVASVARPSAAGAQPAGATRRIGVLTTFSDQDVLARGWDAAFRKGLDAAGWHEGRNVRIDYRWAAGDADRLRAFAKELVASHPDTIFAVTTPAVAALLRETRTLPIVFAQVFDPVGSGFVASLARPGGRASSRSFARSWPAS
jgi:ABC-type uncharacterized transport system substrate-binding protein